KSILVMVLFAILMVAAALSMIRSKKDQLQIQQITDHKKHLVKLLLYGVGIGFVTGLLGAGGGFLLIPTLVLLLKLPMKEAIGTSLFIIALNSLIGFTGDIGHFTFDWLFLLEITAIAIIGIYIGGYLNRKIHGDHLKKGFGWFVLIMGIYIIARETILK
ncbi:MAG: sulfite exporter TauE/SafE family protein, partial [Bacteroidota bacterium]|nr:sulfite exporter TauE/SafE family protein [Bacteroidota bacterium]